MHRLFLLTLLLLPLLPAMAEEELPYPVGQSSQKHAGLTFHLEIPKDYDPAKEYSLIVGLHGAGATETSFATWLEPMVAEDFIVCAPKSGGAAWNKPDVEKAKEIVRHLMKVLSIDEGRLHGAGFSNGGAHLAFLVFDPKLPFATACWMGSGFTGGRVPKPCRKAMAAIALVGEKDRAYGAAKKTPDLLSGKVRTAEFLSQPEIGHEIPEELMPYYWYWLTVMEGRFTPGVDRSFDWWEDLELATDEIAERKSGSFVYFFDDADVGKPEAKALQHQVFFDPLVRHFGRRLTAVMLDRELDGEHMTKLGLTKTPAVAVVKADGTVAARFEGKVDAMQLWKALRSVCADKSPPRK